jgi:predicted nucleotidyltransferase
MKRILRRRVAREAARLLYYNLSGEYKQAKEEAARRLGVTALPGNFEVAVELDRLAGEVEGDDREKLLVDLRREALTVMSSLKAFHPRLIGSVWRGTARKGSDIDIEVFCHERETVIKEVKKAYHITRLEHASKTDEGKTERYFHALFNLPSGHEVEVVIKGLERLSERRKCEVYGDFIVGVTLSQLGKLLAKNPHKRFIPKER